MMEIASKPSTPRTPTRRTCREQHLTNNCTTNELPVVTPVDLECDRGLQIRREACLMMRVYSIWLGHEESRMADRWRTEVQAEPPPLPVIFQTRMLGVVTGCDHERVPVLLVRDKQLIRLFRLTKLKLAAARRVIKHLMDLDQDHMNMQVNFLEDQSFIFKRR